MGSIFDKLVEEYKKTRIKNERRGKEKKILDILNKNKIQEKTEIESVK